MNKALLFVIAILAISSSVVCMTSDEADASEYVIENARIPNIYAVDVGTTADPPTSYTHGSGWATLLLFNKGSPNEAAFINAVENKGDLQSFRQDDVSQPGNKILYILATADDITLYDGPSGDIALEEKHILYRSETTHHIVSGVEVTITLSDETDMLYFGKGYDRKALQQGVNITKATSSGDYVLSSYGSTQTYVSYTIEYYEPSDSKTSAVGWVCTAVGILGIAVLILCGRKQNLQ